MSHLTFHVCSLGLNNVLQHPDQGKVFCILAFFIARIIFESGFGRALVLFLWHTLDIFLFPSSFLFFLGIIIIVYCSPWWRKNNKIISITLRLTDPCCNYFEWEKNFLKTSWEKNEFLLTSISYFPTIVFTHSLKKNRFGHTKFLAW